MIKNQVSVIIILLKNSKIYKKEDIMNKQAEDMFLIVGKYIFENDLSKKYLDLIKNNPAEIREIGSNILEKSIDYVLNSLQC